MRPSYAIQVLFNLATCTILLSWGSLESRQLVWNWRAKVVWLENAAEYWTYCKNGPAYLQSEALSVPSNLTVGGPDWAWNSSYRVEKLESYERVCSTDSHWSLSLSSGKSLIQKAQPMHLTWFQAHLLEVQTWRRWTLWSAQISFVEAPQFFVCRLVRLRNWTLKTSRSCPRNFKLLWNNGSSLLVTKYSLLIR